MHICYLLQMQKTRLEPSVPLKQTPIQKCRPGPTRRLGGTWEVRPTNMSEIYGLRVSGRATVLRTSLAESGVREGGYSPEPNT